MRRRVPFSTPAAASVPVPSTEDTVAFLASCSSAQAAAMLALLNIEAGAGSTLSRKAERVAELSRVLRVYPNYVRAAHWHSLLIAAGDVPGASAVQAVLPVAEGGATVAAPFDRPDGRDLEEVGGSLGSPDPSGVRDTPFGSLIPAPPVGPPPSGGAAAHTDALLRQLVHEHNSLVQNFDAALADRTDRYVREANLGLGLRHPSWFLRPLTERAIQDL